MPSGGNEAFSRVVINALLGVIGNQCVGGTPEQLAEFIKKESVKWAEVIKRSGEGLSYDAEKRIVCEFYEKHWMA